MSDWSSFQSDKNRMDDWRTFLTESKSPHKIEEIEWFGAKKRREKAALGTDRKLADGEWLQAMEEWARRNDNDKELRKKYDTPKKMVKLYRNRIREDAHGRWAPVMRESGIDFDELLEWIRWRFEKGFSDEEIQKIEDLRAQRDAPPKEDEEEQDYTGKARAPRPDPEPDPDPVPEPAPTDTDTPAASEEPSRPSRVTPREAETESTEYKWGKSFGINSQTNADSLLKTFELRKIPPAIANPIADLMIDLADDEGIMLEAVELVGSADEPQRTIKAGSSRELYDFLASLIKDAKMYKKALKALDRWGRTNTVRFIGFPAAVPEFRDPEEEPEPTPDPTPEEEPEPTPDPTPEEEPETASATPGSDTSPDDGWGEHTWDDDTPVSGSVPAATKKAFNNAVKAWRALVSIDKALSPGPPQEQWIKLYQQAAPEFSKAFKTYKDLSPKQELGDPRSASADLLQEQKTFNRWKLIAGIK